MPSPAPARHRRSRAAARGALLGILVSAILAGCGPSGQERPAPAAWEVADAPWAEGLRVGPNGPIPVIVVDQFGYRPGDTKIAVLRRPVAGYDAGGQYAPGQRIQVIDTRTGEVVHAGRATSWRNGAVDPTSGDQAWWFDFSPVRAEGRYVVRDAAAGLESTPFEVADDVYAPVLRAAVRSFFYQRAGQDKSVETAGQPWADAASHLGADQDPGARSWLAKGDATTARDLRGGWYDAGDYTKYTPWHAGYLVTLLQTYREHPDAVGDDLGIPESGNGVSDLLDEIDWGLAWLMRAQQADGSVLSIEVLDQASPPSAADGPSYYGPPTTHATQRAAAALALAASVHAESGGPNAAARAQDLVRRARAAWDWASAHPDVVYFNNDEARQPGSGGLGGGQQETDDAGRLASRVEAAVFLYGATGDEKFRDFALTHRHSYLPAGSQTQWNVDRQEVLLHFADLPDVPDTVRSEIRDDFRTALVGADAFLPAVTSAADPYRAPLGAHTWGSNQSTAQVGRMLALASDYEVDVRLGRVAMTASQDYVHYLHGVNPVGLVYLTTMADAGAEHSASTLYHSWFADGTRWDSANGNLPGPAPGFVVGGPNPAYSADACCPESCSGARDECSAHQPPSGQPAAKAYLQFNDGWPANSWEITENSNGYQAAYIRLLAAFA